MICFLSFFGCNKNPASPTTGTIQGQITNATGDTLIAGANVSTTPPTSAVTTDAQGKYTILDVSPGQYTVAASKGGYKPGSVTITVAAGKATTANIDLGGNNPPAIPTLISPSNASTNQLTTITLSWSCTDPDGDSLTYDVYLGKTSPPTSILSTAQSSTSITKSGLDTSSTYYWRIVAKDNREGTSTSGTVWSFTTQNSQIPTNGLVAYYPFDGNANDESGNGRNGIIRSTPTFIPGVVGTCINLKSDGGYMDSLGDHVLIPVPQFSAMNAFTISLWVKKDSLSSTDGEDYISFGYHDNQWIGILQGRYLTFSPGNDSSAIQVNYDASYASRFVLFTMVYGNGQFQAYADTTLLGSHAVGSIPTIPNVGAIARHWWYNGTSTSTRFYGQVDEVRIYNRALSDVEIQALYYESGLRGN